MKNEKLVPYNLRLPEKLKARLERQAKEEKRSLNQQLIVLLENSLSKDQKPATVAA